MLYICVGDVMDVLFSVCIVRCGAVGARIRDVECFVMQTQHDILTTSHLHNVAGRGVCPYLFWDAVLC